MSRNNQTSPNGNGNVATLVPPITDDPSVEQPDNDVDPSTDDPSTDDPSTDAEPAGLPTFNPASMVEEYPERMQKLTMKQCRDFPEYSALRNYPSAARRIIHDAIIAGAIRHTRGDKSVVNVDGNTKPYTTDEPYWFQWLARGAIQFDGVGNPRIVRAAACVIADDLKNHPIEKVGTTVKPVNGEKSAATVISDRVTVFTQNGQVFARIRMTGDRQTDETLGHEAAANYGTHVQLLADAAKRAEAVATRKSAIDAINALPIADDVKNAMIAMIPDA